MSDDTDALSAEELEAIESLGLGAPSKSEKRDIVAIFRDIIKSKDTLKTANLDKTEMYPVRVLRSTALFANIFEMDIIEKWLHNESEIILGESLSRDGFFIESMITSKQEKKIGTKQQRGESKWWNKNKPQG
jgi:N6-adenosine-specific RNA methylase IME4